MRVVYDSRLNLHGVPVKDRVTRRAPHLRAPRRLENHFTTRGTRFGILLEELHRLNRLRVACVTLGHNLVAILANGVGAQTADPLGRYKTLASFKRTLSNKRLFFFWRSILQLPNRILYLAKYRHVLSRARLLPEFFQGVVRLFARKYSLHGREEALFPLIQNSLAMVLVLAVDKRLWKETEKNSAVPQLVAAHAVRILSQPQEKGANTVDARLKVAVGALETLDSLATHGTVHSLQYHNSTLSVLETRFFALYGSRTHDLGVAIGFSEEPSGTLVRV